ncbi:RNA-binding protein 42-like protein [Carex littledalei]|uniref:RNA-binding protein 42-like protein n=1 Tax=Carex littledalei TaxID=544730 RepID=A0A833V3E9_9POAL|nr:RNA-binding protein 42-like protein [Carex littledalei]
MSTQSIQPMANQFTYFPVPFHLQNAYQMPPATAQLVGAHVVYPTASSVPQFQQAQQQLLQKDAQILTPEAIASVKAAIANTEIEQKLEAKKKAVPRKAAGQTWEDPTLANWPESDFRLFCGDLGNEVNDDVLTRAFSKYPSFNMARVVRDKWTSKTKGYGFVSFANASDMAAALKDMNESATE